MFLDKLVFWTINKLTPVISSVRGLVGGLCGKVGLGSLWNKVPDDKQLHFTGGMLLSLVSGVLLLHFGHALWLNFLVVALIGVAKEVWDHFHPATDTCEIMDAVATVCGCVPVSLILWLLVWLL